MMIRLFLRDDKKNLDKSSSRGCNVRILHNSCVCKVPHKRGCDLKLANTVVNNEVLVIWSLQSASGLHCAAQAHRRMPENVGRLFCASLAPHFLSNTVLYRNCRVSRRAEDRGETQRRSS